MDKPLRPQGTTDRIRPRHALQTSSGPSIPIRNTDSIRSAQQSLETHRNNNKHHLQNNKKYATETTETYISSRPQTQRQFYQAMATQELITQIALIPIDMRIFLPKLQSLMTSIVLHNLPRSEPFNRLNNASFTLLIQRMLQLPIPKVMYGLNSIRAMPMQQYTCAVVAILDAWFRASRAVWHSKVASAPGRCTAALMALSFSTIVGSHRT